MKKVFEIIGRITILAICYIIGYVIFLKLNVENCWKYCFAYIYGGVIGQIYLLSSIKFKGKE